MVTGLLAKMGCWVGTARQHGAPYNPKGFFENVYFKRFVSQVYTQKGLVCNTTEGWQENNRSYDNPNFVKDLVRALYLDGYRGGPIALKNVQVAAILDIFQKYLPNATYLFVRRNDEHVIKSFMEKYHTHNNMNVPEPKVADWVKNANRVCDELATKRIDADDIIAGNTADLEQIVESVGLVWDNEKASEFIEPSFWHSR